MSEIIFIEEDIICTVTKYYLDFYSISMKNNNSSWKNEDETIEEKGFIGKLRVDETIGMLIEEQHAKKEQ